MDITSTLAINSSQNYLTFNVGALISYGNTVTTANIGGTGTTYTGNTTTGTITTTYTGTGYPDTKHIGDATNHYVGGSTNVMPPNNQDVDDLKLTIN